MYNKLILSSILCGLLGTSSIILGMKKPSNNKNQPLVVFHNEFQKKEWKCYDANDNEVKNFNIQSSDFSVYTLVYDDMNNQTIQSKTNSLIRSFPLKQVNKLSAEQIDRINQKFRLPRFKLQTKDKARIYITIDNQLIRIIGTHEIDNRIPIPEKKPSNLSSSQESANEPKDFLNLNDSEKTSDKTATTLTLCMLMDQLNRQIKVVDPNTTNLNAKENISDATQNNDNNREKPSDNKKPSSSYTKKRYLIGGTVAVGFLATLGTYFAYHPEKMTQLLQLFFDKAAHLLQPLKDFSLSHLKRN